MKDVNSILFRCSSLSHIMADTGLTEKQAETLEGLLQRTKLTEKQQATLEKLIDKRDNPGLPEGAKTACIDTFASWYYGRREEAYAKFIEKGNECEEQSITLLSLVRKQPYFKNEQQLTNEFISGTPDLFLKEKEIVLEVEEIKTSWDIYSFLRAKYKPINKDHFWQVTGYMALTGAKVANVNYCLVNATAELIDDEKRRLAYAMRETQDSQTPEYLEQCRQIERNMIYDIADFRKRYPYYSFDTDVDNWDGDIPEKERVFSFRVDRNEDDIAKIYERVKMCRKWIAENIQ